MMITHCMARSVDYCNKVMRKRFISEGLSWQDFREEGIEEDVLRSCFGDGMVDKVINKYQGDE